MVLAEFSKKEQEIIFTEMRIRDILMIHIQKYDSELSKDAVINLAMEYFLESLEKTDYPQDFINETKETYIMSKYPFIEYIQSQNIDFTPETVRDDMLDIDYDENRNFVNLIIIEMNGMCCKCRSRQNLEIHNLKPLNKYPYIGLQPGNAIAICHDCHEAYHAKYSPDEVNPVTFNSFRIGE